MTIVGIEETDKLKRWRVSHQIYKQKSQSKCSLIMLIDHVNLMHMKFKLMYMSILLSAFAANI